MGNALVIFKVSAEPDNMESVEAALKEVKTGKFQESKREPVAFGIEIIKVGFVIPDKTDGALPNLEEEVKGLENVDSAEVETMTLI